MIEFQSNEKLSSPCTPEVSELFSQFKRNRTWGFTTLLDDDLHWNECQAIGDHLKSEFNHLVVIGMGGSSLGSAALIQALAPDANVSYWNSSDPDILEQWNQSSIPTSQVHWLVTSKSGSTLETCILTNFALQQIQTAGVELSKHMSVITEPKHSTLSQFAKSYHLKTYPHRLDIGGRFSVFTNVGMIPCAFAGLSLKKIREGMKALEQNDQLVTSFIKAAEQCCKHKLSSLIIWPYSQKLNKTSDWIAQLWSESLGKSEDRNGKVASKVAMPSICNGAISQHSLLQQMSEGSKDHWVIFFTSDHTSKSTPTVKSNWQLCHKNLEGFRLNEISQVQAQATHDSLVEAGAYCSQFKLQVLSEFNLSQLLYLFEWSIAILGERLNIDVFSQPGVERGKVLTKLKLNITS